ncbi:MAG: long-chain-fatty-acid--CoA ligase [Alphaproteobacteria bacterium]|nr:long-chain-fatty-acid--CoA ligase [Alphaproteobacteria bacterium]MDP6566247.1 long-chain-fatty-acid--CoA ligase [Alphaproteobacteria bacterium]MDP6814639.1 long-chain-fatty-acid--CoA ligase [Alphaproteobacteria bacterium]
MQLTHAVKRSRQVNRDGTATLFEGRRHSWGQFADRVARLAAGLVEIGVEPGDRVAILALNSDRYLEFFFAVPWAGGVFVPINTRLAPPEVAYWLNDSGAEVLFVDDNFTAMLEPLRGKIDGVRRFVYLGDGAVPDGLVHYESLIDGRAAMADAGRRGDDLAGIFYTGGTTGVSKGVMLSHTNLMFNALNVTPLMHFNRWTNWLHAAPMFHLADGTGTFAVVLAAGGHCFIPGFEPLAALRAIQQYRPTDTVFVPTMVNMIVNHPQVADFDISSLQRVIYGASPMPAAVIERALQLMPEIRFVHGYGQTESSPFLTALDPEFLEREDPSAEKRASIGHSAAAVEVRVLDENDQEVAPGVVGEICARGMNVMQGYWNKPELTAETLRNGWLHTGDGGYMDADGCLFIVDRVKDMIITGGENVYSAEVENAIHQHAAVAECAVIGVPDDTWGERVHAIVRCKDDASVDAEALIAHCHQLIANYKCPRSVDFVDQPLPLSGAGKILKTELRKPFWDGKAKQVN